MDEQQLIQLGYQIIQQDPLTALQLIAKAQLLNPQELMAKALQGDQESLYMLAVIMAQQSTQMAKFGAKLNYIKQLRGVCPDGYEMQYFKKGGQFCKQCIKKKKKMEEGGKTPSGPIDSFKCGRKTKKTVKAEKGTTLFAKTGKGEDFMAGSPVDYWDKPAQSLQYPDGSQFMTRVIPQPGDTNFVAPEFILMNDPRYPASRDKFNKLWNSRKLVTKPKVEDNEVPL